MRWFYRWYGANPLHLLTLIASFALAGYAAEKLLPRDTEAIAIWFIGAVIGHDLLLMPLYTIADLSVLAVFRHRRQQQPPVVSWINYLRVPAVLSGTLLLIWFPLIFRLPSHYAALTGLPIDPYMTHWLAVTGVLFLLSAVALAVRLSTRPFRRAARRGPDVDPLPTSQLWEPDPARTGPFVEQNPRRTGPLLEQNPWGTGPSSEQNPWGTGPYFDQDPGRTGPIFEQENGWQEEPWEPGPRRPAPPRQPSPGRQGPPWEPGRGQQGPPRWEEPGHRRQEPPWEPSQGQQDSRWEPSRGQQASPWPDDDDPGPWPPR
jgi:hypothetical protein